MMMSLARSPKLLFQTTLAIWSLLLCACTVNPPRDVQRLCADCQRLELTPNNALPSLAYISTQEDFSQTEFIHVYLEGDGQPWIRGLWPAKNPSSRGMTALKLMLLDPHPSIYLNRPCYGYQNMPEYCREELWTNARYGSEVVDSMGLALNELRLRYPKTRWVLIGHSGGGALAMLLAARVDNVAAVVTLAANLDHQAWTQLKHYSPLDKSLNPVDQPQLPADTVRWHFAGGKDAAVPAQITANAAGRDPGSEFYLEPDFDHGCCWQHIWPNVLQKLRHQLTGTK